MKVLHLLQSNRFSGAENVVCQIISMMKEEPGIQIAYCSRDGQIREALKDRNIEYYPISEITVEEVKRVIKEYEPNIIHAHDMRASFIAARACGKLPLISHIHNNAFSSRTLSMKSIGYIIAAIKAKHIFWVSSSSYEGYFFNRCFEKKSEVLYNILDIDVLYNKMKEDRKEYNYDVVYIGRLTAQKDPYRLMKVFSILIRNVPSVKIAVVGTGELEVEIKKLAQKYKLLKNVDFLGFQSNPLKLLHDSKVMIMTSRWEGTPMCALEALALGVPIVATPTDGLKDIVYNGRNGFLSGDDNELADRIIEIIQDTERQKQMSNECISKAIIYNNKEQYRNEILKAYSKCMEV